MRIGFHEQPFRTRGHGWEQAAGYAYGLTIGDVAATLREWSRWEVAWSVQPKPVRRLAYDRHLAASKLEGAAVPVIVDSIRHCLSR